jgi:hypothetical protein
LAIAANPPSAHAASHNGSWSVLIITDKGPCDRGYRYSLKVSNGRVRYQGEAGVNLRGTVVPNGLVRVSIKLGGQGASGTGRLSANSGVGTWRGIGSSGTCSGHWEAERR